VVQPLPLPLPEPPADEVAALLDELRDARRELADAGRVIRLLTIAREDFDALSGHQVAKHFIENATAERRAELWAARVGFLVRRARALGLNVADQ
jgi:hypothetical protein